jgi:hypothetical protein
VSTVSADRRRGCVSPSSALLGAPAARDSDRVDVRVTSRESSEESRRRGNRFRRGWEGGDGEGRKERKRGGERERGMERNGTE